MEDDEFVRGIRSFAAANGAADRFHVTLTRFWVRLVQHHIDAYPHLLPVP